MVHNNGHSTSAAITFDGDGASTLDIASHRSTVIEETELLRIVERNGTQPLIAREDHRERMKERSTAATEHEAREHIKIIKLWLWTRYDVDTQTLNEETEAKEE
ncbi:hypothetical protein N7G274_001264 [Stereocaulon virgatum]|uniref:Uncharacterized protein n=1 Tax=Stereocaulon virgatum TaxID=373712 RepID=A0ABR4AP66_9LECA